MEIIEKTTRIVAVDTETRTLENYLPLFFNENQYFITTKERVIEATEKLKPYLLILTSESKIETTREYLRRAKELKDKKHIKKICLITDIKTGALLKQSDLGIDIIMYRPITELKIEHLRKNMNRSDLVELIL
ncbi:MAG TPA: hypothetical protein VJB89_03020 [Candidatus Nanoarchaeia archaeon]|nr:hypothetical protein [Candidatus Nanoarchaeia archaeon]